MKIVITGGSGFIGSNLADKLISEGEDVIIIDNLFTGRLSYINPAAKFYLADSIGKKINVVNNVAKELELKNVVAQQIRVENVNDNFDFIVSRAVTSLDVFYNWIKTKINKNNLNTIPNGILYLKGGNIFEELKTVQKKHKIYNLNIFFTEDFFETKKVVHIFK